MAPLFSTLPVSLSSHLIKPVLSALAGFPFVVAAAFAVSSAVPAALSLARSAETTASTACRDAASW